MRWMKSGPVGSSPSRSKSFQQSELLQRHRALSPRPGLAHRVAAIIVGERRLDVRRPARHVVGGQDAAMLVAADVHDLLGAAEAVDRFGDKTVRPGFPRPFDLRNAIAAGALGFLDDAGIGGGERFVGEQRAGRRQRVVRQVHRGRGRPILAEQVGDHRDRGIGALEQRIAVLGVADRRLKHVGDR